jgi:hypothetical protein
VTASRPHLSSLIAHLQGLREKATPGPWAYDEDEDDISGDDGKSTVIFHDGMPQDEADAVLIVAAVNALPTLLRELEVLESARGDQGALMSGRYECFARANDLWESAPEHAEVLFEHAAVLRRLASGLPLPERR